MPPVGATTDASERVAEILDAACRVVVRQGAHGLRMSSVADEAGVSKALVHYYFATRQELLRSAFAWSEERWQAAVSGELAGEPTGAGRVERALLMSIEGRQPFSDQRALWNEVWSSLRYDDELRPLVDASYRAWIGRLSELIGEGLADGSVAPGVDAEEAAWRLAVVGDGVDSMLYLGLLDRAAACDLMLAGIRRELTAA
jgi:AcrR family transcriptional regulator